MRYDADVIIIGSGPAGAAAALQLGNKTRALVLDVGDTHDSTPPAADPLSETLGTSLDGISHITGDYVSPKLRSPLFRYVTRSWRKLSPIQNSDFRGELSLALGGLANAWGSGLYEFDDKDLRGFPVNYSDLKPYYNLLTEHIGISGGDELLGDVSEEPCRLLPSLPLSGTPKVFYSRSKQPHTAAFLARKGIKVAKQRLGILTQEHRGRPAYTFDGKDFFRPGKEAIYQPAYTIRDLERTDKIDYRNGILVQRFEETDDGVCIYASDLTNNQRVKFYARLLLIGAGAINTARLVLQSLGDYSTRLSILENPISFVPFVSLNMMGTPSDCDSFTGAQLAILFEGPQHPDRVQGSFYNLAGVLPPDFMFDFPFTVSGNNFCLENILGAMGVLQLFYSDAPSPGSFLRLKPDGSLEVRYEQRGVGRVEREIITAFRQLGFWSLPALIRRGEPGGSFHYAGTLPMSDHDNSNTLHADRYGRLGLYKRVYAIDASLFPLLPAKNLSLTIMANAMRIADLLPI